ncbi:butyrophilin subfamily 3 member A1-like [Empidonax traillii]|uniref:butyrophilin subfamily 3 member A1-like n=1 Tax=Empidonax traillii TaxID=164674 RepID=UPI000FFD25B7|nr:butyrophilin subfamily 3 member A1-like [Empidonax traillii]
MDFLSLEKTLRIPRELLEFFGIRASKLLHWGNSGNFHGPLLVLDGLEDSGIRLKCLSERLFSEVQVLWMDGKGRNITGNPLSTDTAGNAGSSIVLTPGSGNAVSCRIIDSLGKTSTESSIVIAESFFPAISPWLPAFVMILLFGIFLVLAAVYKLRINKKAMDREKNAQKQIQEDIEDLKMELEEVQEKFQKENQEMESKIGEKIPQLGEFREFWGFGAQGKKKKKQQNTLGGVTHLGQVTQVPHLAQMPLSQQDSDEISLLPEQIQAQLEFRRAQSNAVPLTLDELCKHPELSLRDQSRVVSCSATSEQLHPKPVIVSKESFSQGKHYWEVEVGAGSGWELGVLAEEIRDSLQNGGMVLPQEREQVLSLGYSRGEFSIPRGCNCRPCPVLGVFLDQESHNLSFFDVEGKSLLASLPLRFSGNLFPFFSPGSNEKGLGIRSVGG